ncbi:hypothetical protein BO71DRAFT_431272 [Aspergillus ellipticus CBS 707.79]|uniref:Uncharacterized protein n=1 Tax=Aspergillus ellipticus CBS 707.79 TaxID=1448320 RepID=A0A319D6R8_9EURO|nr:hypothetical protein BO71DRAFT_431272 [Aspergillus ellipticus CBS 707.79]
MSAPMETDMPISSYDVQHWQIETTWFYFPCMDNGHRSGSERFERALEDLNNSIYAMYRYCPILHSQSWGVLIFIHHPTDLDLPAMLIHARRQLENLCEDAKMHASSNGKSDRPP